MFRKENSSCSTTKSNNNTADNASNNNKNNKGKKKGGNAKNTAASAAASNSSSALDVPLRKSDIRNLKQRVKEFFGVDNLNNDNSNNNGSSNEGQPSETQQQEEHQIQAVSSQILDQVFVMGSICSRQLYHAELGKLTLYVRTPNAAAEWKTFLDRNSATTKKDDENNEPQFMWPYTASQVVWMVQPPMPNTNQVEVALPTVALLSVVPHAPTIMPTVWIPCAASKFLCRGAHLMRAGMMNLPSFVSTAENNNNNNPRAALLQQQPPRIVAICCAGNPQPMAVGVVEAAVQSPTDIGVGTKGVGATIWTCYGDDLWYQQGKELKSSTLGTPKFPNPFLVDIATSTTTIEASYNDGQYGNPGFLQGEQVVRIVSSLSAQQSDDDDDDDEEEPTKATSAWDANETENSTAEQVEATTNAEDEAPMTSNIVSDASNDEAEETGNGNSETQQLEEEEEQGADNQEDQSVSQEELLHQAVCKALLTSIAPKDLPMTIANFYANHVLPNRPPNTTITLKQTKYKKFGNYLQEQVQQKLITLGPGPNKGNKDKTGYLMSYDKRHPDLLSYKQEHSQEVQDAKDTKTAAAQSAKNKLVLVNLYVVPHHFVSLLQLDPDAVKATHASSPERAGTGMLTMTEVRKLLEDYLERENLVDLDQAQLNGPLFDALYKKKKDSEVDTNTLEVSRKDLADTWLAAMSPAYALVQMPGNQVQKVAKGNPPKVHIEVSMRQSKKFITKLRGMETYGVNGPLLAKDIGRRLACQATVETTSEKGAALAKGCVEIVLGGNFADELEALLLGDEKLCPSHGGIKNSDYKLPKGSIDVVLRKGVPARKGRKGGKK